MIRLQYLDVYRNIWVDVSTWENEKLAWWSLGSDFINYRTIDHNDNVLTDKSNLNQSPIQGERNEDI